jgi:hypothetical protein
MLFLMCRANVRKLIQVVVGDTNCGFFFPVAYKIPPVSAVVESLYALQLGGYQKEAQWLETGYLVLGSITWLGLRERIRDPILHVFACYDYFVIAAPVALHRRYSARACIAARTSPQDRIMGT